MKANTVLLLLLFSFVVSGVKAQVDVGDSLALVDLYNSTDGPNWNLRAGWLTKQPVSTWAGIGMTGEHVSSIYLFINNMHGKLPASIGNLTKLITLSLATNKLIGELPSSIGNLSEMTSLDLSNNSIAGQIPAEISHCKALTELSLHNNRFGGSLPAEIGNIEAIQTITLDHNRITGSLPASMGYLRNLYFIDFSYNQISGTLPSSFENLTRMREMYLSYNQIEGSIPASFGNIKFLDLLALDHNRLTGPVPTSLQKLQWLEYLDLEGNFLSENRTDTPHVDINFIVNVRYNRYTFTGLEYLYAHTPLTQYAPQAPIDIHERNQTLYASAGGTLSNNTYKWFRVADGITKTVKNDSSFSPRESGDYYAQITNVAVPGLILRTDTIHFSLAKNDSRLHLMLSPNPATSFVTIYGLDEKANAIISVADVSGHIWIRRASHMQLTMNVDISKLKPGHYEISVNDGKEVKTVHMVKE